MDPRVTNWFLFLVLGGLGYFVYKCLKVWTKHSRKMAQITANKECELARIAAEQIRASEEAQLKALEKVKNHASVAVATNTLAVQATNPTPQPTQQASRPQRHTPTRRPPRR